MRLPSPDDLGKAPLWENYVVAQAVQACLGLIPQNALAVGAAVDGPRVTLLFQLSIVTVGDQADIADVVDELGMLVGDAVEVDHRCEVRDEPQISLRDGVRWVYLAHVLN